MTGQRLDQTEVERSLDILAHIQPPPALNARILQRVQAEELRQQQTRSGPAWRSFVFAGTSAILLLGLLALTAREHHVSSFAERASTPHDGKPSADATAPDHAAASASMLSPSQDALAKPLEERYHLPVQPRPVLTMRHTNFALRRPGGSPGRSDEGHQMLTPDPAVADAGGELAAGDPTDTLGQTLPTLAESTAPGDTLPKFKARATPGDPLPAFPLVALGTRLPTFAQSIRNGDQ